MATEEDRALRMDHSLTAILMLLVQDMHQRAEKPKVKARSPESLLFLAGFRQAEITRLTNMPKATLSRHLKAEGLT